MTFTFSMEGWTTEPLPFDVTQAEFDAAVAAARARAFPGVEAVGAFLRAYWPVCPPG